MLNLIHAYDVFMYGQVNLNFVAEKTKLSTAKPTISSIHDNETTQIKTVEAKVRRTDLTSCSERKCPAETICKSSCDP